MKQGDGLWEVGGSPAVNFDMGSLWQPICLSRQGWESCFGKLLRMV